MILAIVAVMAGTAILIAAALNHARDTDQDLDTLMEMTPLSLAGITDEEPIGPIAGRAVKATGKVVERLDRGRSLSHALEQAMIPLRPGEMVILTASSGLVLSTVLFGLLQSRAVALAGPVIAGLVAMQVVRRRITKRRKAFEEQLPDALSLIASSLAAGHTFLRAIQMMCEESQPPLAEEFARVCAETRLGDPVVVALERMASRLQVRDLNIVVQAIRIQQSVGGRLADLLHTLSDFIRARDEVRREVRVLTAEGRISAYVLACMVPVVFGAIHVMNPAYTAPLFSGWGRAILVYAAGSVISGVALILKMVRIDI